MIQTASYAGNKEPLKMYNHAPYMIKFVFLTINIEIRK